MRLQRFLIPSVSIVSTLLVVLLSACGPLAKASSVPFTGPRSVSLAPARPVPASPAGSAFRLWQDGNIFDCVKAMLASAAPAQPLWIEMYEFGRRDLAAALLLARDRGVDVRLIVDRTVPVSARTADRLAAAGLAVRAYPVDDHRHQIDHLKLVVAGGDSLVGGMNWGQTSARNHDYALETQVPAVVNRLSAIFLHDWALAGGRPSPLIAAPGPVVETTPGQEVRSALLDAIRSARTSVVAEIFTLTNAEVIAALARAHRAGVGVRVLLDPNQEVNRAGFDLLRAAGVEVRWYPIPTGAKLHAKAGLFDGHRLLVGSANWSLSGLEVNHELDLLVEDPAVASAFSSRFERDWQASA